MNIDYARVSTQDKGFALAAHDVAVLIFRNNIYDPNIKVSTTVVVLMTKKKKSQFQRPDETFSSGPITVSRFGLNTVLQSNWQENDFEKFQETSG